MTRAQRLELLKQIEKDIYVPSIESTLLDDAKSCAIHSVIRELEQEPIIDKIRAEIEQKLDTHGYISLYNKAINDVLQIIDKYKADKEQE